MSRTGQRLRQMLSGSNMVVVPFVFFVLACNGGRQSG